MHIDLLSEACIGSVCEIVSVDLPCTIRSRLFELGFLPGSLIKAAICAPSGETLAFWVKGAMIALRKKSCKKIAVKFLE